jgi:putative nucleotidyltransferase with HDIG domain
MATGLQKRTRSERVAALELPPGLFERILEYLQRGDVLGRLGLCLLTAVMLWCVTGGWAPALGFRTGFTPLRDITARIAFTRKDPQATQAAQDKARRSVHYVYEQDKEPLVQLDAALINRVTQVLSAKTPELLDKSAWLEFMPPRPGTPPLSDTELAEHFQRFQEALPNQAAVENLDKAVAAALGPWEQHGMLHKLPQEHDQGNQQEIIVHPKDKAADTEIVSVADVLIGEGELLRRRLGERIASPELAERVFDWLRPRLPEKTLTLSRDETSRRKEEAVKQVGDILSHFRPGDMLAQAGKPLNDETLDLLRLEHATLLEQLSPLQRLNYSLATLGMFIALLTLCGVYVVHYEPKLLESVQRFTTLLGLVVVAVGIAHVLSRDDWRWELVPLLLFGMTVAIAYNQELALLLSSAVTLVIVVSIGQGLSDFVVLAASVATAILLVGRIRSRTKLVYVGLCVGGVSALTTLGVGTVFEQPFEQLLKGDAVRFGSRCVVAGFLMTGLLPFIERLFGVQTELSLLELGDVAHPLLQELVRRAPGTYNHSINVASIAEAAAESIGARGLLVRVGAYFHDIGKMLKPGYFVENQGQDVNRHDSLMPAMSTLIIIAHIKDGADLARQHHLPQSLIDFIQQHHGTTLVEYFYRRASEQSENDPDAAEVEESAFRYPGPKPQTKEAAVLMLSDAVESASRALVEPTPARIESLVHDIAMKRLLDGQFDSCGLTLQELATIEDSLVKSLTAVYHGRVKYPGQRSA